MRALAALSDEADDLERTLGDLERRVGAGVAVGLVLYVRQHDALRLRLRREALRALAVTHAFEHAVRAPRRSLPPTQGSPSRSSACP